MEREEDPEKLMEREEDPELFSARVFCFVGQGGGEVNKEGISGVTGSVGCTDTGDEGREEGGRGLAATIV
jgi:hypothetical protein